MPRQRPSNATERLSGKAEPCRATVTASHTKQADGLCSRSAISQPSGTTVMLPRVHPAAACCQGPQDHDSLMELYCSSCHKLPASPSSSSPSSAAGGCPQHQSHRHCHWCLHHCLLPLCCLHPARASRWVLSLCIAVHVTRCCWLPLMPPQYDSTQCLTGTPHLPTRTAAGNAALLQSHVKTHLFIGSTHSPTSPALCDAA